jgi:hypothetical protein
MTVSDIFFGIGSYDTPGQHGKGAVFKKNSSLEVLR